MKYKTIFVFFAVSTPLCVLLRTLQLLFTTDRKGFAAQDYRLVNFNMTVLLFAAVIVMLILGALTHRRPAKPPRVGPLLGVISVLYGIWTLFESLFSSFASVVPGWQISLFQLFGLLTALLLIAYGVCPVLHIKIPPLLFILPVLFWVVKLICVFTTLNTLALTAGHILLLTTYCAVLFFMLEFAKLMNGIDEDYNFKKLLASGLCAVNLCLSSSLPYFTASALGASPAVSESVSSMLLTLLTGIFILIFLLSHFSAKNQ